MATKKTTQRSARAAARSTAKASPKPALARVIKKVVRSARGAAKAKAKAGKKAHQKRWTPEKEDLSKIRISVTTIGDLLLTAADRHPNDDAVVFPDRKISYGELAARAISRARGLQALGVKPKSHVGLLLPTCMEFVEYFFAIALCGAVVQLPRQR